jgi:hypothetical protein
VQTGLRAGARTCDDRAVVRFAFPAFLIVVAVFAFGCGEPPAETPPPAPSAASVPGVYAGVFPCDNCPGIDTIVWLLADGRFILEQRFPGDAERDEPASRAHALGRWQWREGDDVLALAGEGPERLFERPDEVVLLMRNSSPVEHRLERLPAAPEFAGMIRLRGMARPQGEGFVFSECLTGYELPLLKGGDYKRFARQFRSVVPRGQAARAEIDARFSWATDGTPRTLTIERFVTLRNDGAC